ncbi:MAG: type II secretion system protein N [Granulosicoccaceae bacterium]|jgi:general secretion pathway protein C
MGDLQGMVRGMHREQLARYLPWLVNILLAVLLVNSMLNVTLQWLSSTSGEDTPATIAAPAAEKVQRQQAAQIAQLHLFGKAQLQSVKQAPTVAPETKLNLVLRGVIASGRAAGALAIVGPRGGKEKSYAIGETLPGGAELKEIYADRVILQHRGRLETLTLQRKLLDNKQLRIQ